MLHPIPNRCTALDMGVADAVSMRAHSRCVRCVLRFVLAQRPAAGLDRPASGAIRRRIPRPAMLLIIDNYDSFTYNLVQYFGEMGVEMKVVRNDAVGLDEIRRMAPQRICISPGPCTPDEAGISCAVIKEFGPHVPLLGVCLGHQAIGQAYGGEVVRADRLMHGKTSPIRHRGGGVFSGLPDPFDATRYHSLIVRRESLPECLEITAWTAEGEIMGLSHHQHPVHGVQFHPESILTAEGKRLLRNFLELG